MVLGLSDGMNQVNKTFILFVMEPVPVPKSLMNTGPPEFIDSLDLQTVLVGKSLTYVLPDIMDPDSDQWKVAISLGSAGSFCTATTTSVTIAPTS